MRLGIISLGCDKATVDSEALVARFVGHGALVADDLHEADVILVNTCGFIDAAKQESIDAMLQAARMKDEGRCRAVVAVGCLVARYENELRRELPEVDYFCGFHDLPGLVPQLVADGLLHDPLVAHPGTRHFLGTKPHVRYLKISEGCDHTCAFCAIPLMRGKHRSRPVEELIREAQELEAQGAREINLVAQDLGHYGRDLDAPVRLPDLVRTLLRETGVPWYRLLYVYSAGISPALVEVLAGEPRLVPYLDMPIQHASDRMLELMRRPERQETIRTKVRWLRSAVPDIAVRTTVLVGFPSETADDVRTLLDVMDEIQFDRLGVFPYSPQEGTRAAALPDDVPDAEKRARVDQVVELQRAISGERLARHVGRDVELLVDEGAAPDDPGDLVARAAFQADDVDGVTYLRTRKAVGPGDLVRARVVDALDYDLVAEL